MGSHRVAVRSRREVLWQDAKKYFHYLFDRKPFDAHFSDTMPSARSLAAAHRIRGETHGAALFVHGLMPRSGTVYVGELLRKHLDIHAFPYNIWELPFLQHAADIQQLEDRFLWSYEQNMDKIQDGDFLPVFGAAIVNYLYGDAPQGKRIMLKVPSVEYLHLFSATFPAEHLLVLVRDGRDVVASTVKTWPQIGFSMACRRWQRSARMALDYDREMSCKQHGYWLGKFEDAVAAPDAFAREACKRFDLEPTRFPYEDSLSVPVHGSSELFSSGAIEWAAVAKPEGFDPRGRWRDWSRRRKSIFKRIAGRELIELGYCKDLNW